MAEPTYPDLLRRLISGADMDRQEAHWAFAQIMDGLWSEPQVAGLLVALAAKGETSQEIAGAAQAMREHVLPIDSTGLDVIDTCGTGGTGLRTFNISTAAALVAAGAGVHVAKHGNRTATRASGSADALAALGVNLDAPPAAVERCLRHARVCFCFAVRCHPAMKYAVPVRKALGVRTIFNLLGPLTNPARAARQVMGVFRPELTETIAAVHALLGTRRAFIVHAEDGLDEISTTAASRISELRNGQVATGIVQPEEFGLPRARMEDLLIRSPAESAEVIQAVLAGRPGPARDIVVLNAAAALAVADAADSIGAALSLACRSIDSGAARLALDTLVRISNEKA